MNTTLGFLTGGTAGFMGLVIYMGVIFGIMWLIVIRPQRKREKAVTNMQNSIKVGDKVLLNTGLYGTVVDVINDLFIIELGLNKSVRIPVKKAAVAGVEEPNLSIAKPSVEEPVVEDIDDVDEDEFEDEE